MYRGECQWVEIGGVFEQVEEEHLCCDGVVEGAVRSVVREFEVLCHVLQRVAGRVGPDGVGEVEGVHDGVGQLDAAVSQEAEVEVGVVRDERGYADEADEGRGYALDGVCTVEVALADAGEGGDERADAPLGVDEALESVERPAALELDCANLNDGVFLGVQACGLKVEGDPDVFGRVCVVWEQGRSS